MFLLIGVVLAGHNDMFSCRGKKNCGVAELTDANWERSIAAAPHFVMFYAPWCGHCKQLAPKLKSAGKQLEAAGVAVGAVDVEPNPSVQSKFPDIRGFPTLKFVKAKGAVDYNGPREAEDIVQFAKEQAAKSGVTLIEPVATKSYDELYSFFGRAALDDKPALLLVGSGDCPDWFNKLHAAVKTKVPFETETRDLLTSALAASKDSEVKNAIRALVDDIDVRANKGTPLYAAAYSNDPATKLAFNASTLFAAHVDRKNLYASTVEGIAVPAKVNLEEWARQRATTLEDPVAIPQVPKPKSVLAAEERAQRKREKAAAVAPIQSANDLSQNCYALTTTCVIAIGADVSALAAKFSKNGFSFASLDANAPVAPALLAGLDAPALVVLKTGKRPRAARVSNVDSFDKLLDDVLAGGAKFDKFNDGLPQWPSSDEDAATDDDYDL